MPLLRALTSPTPKRPGREPRASLPVGSSACLQGACSQLQGRRVHPALGHLRPHRSGTDRVTPGVVPTEARPRQDCREDGVLATRCGIPASRARVSPAGGRGRGALHGPTQTSLAEPQVTAGEVGHRPPCGGGRGRAGSRAAGSGTRRPLGSLAKPPPLQGALARCPRLTKAPVLVSDVPGLAALGTGVSSVVTETPPPRPGVQTCAGEDPTAGVRGEIHCVV